MSRVKSPGLVCDITVGCDFLTLYHCTTNELVYRVNFVSRDSASYAKKYSTDLNTHPPNGSEYLKSRQDL